MKVWTGLPLFESASDGWLPGCCQELSGSARGVLLDQPNHRLLLKMDSVLLS